MTKRRIRSEAIPRWHPADEAMVIAQYPHMKTRVIARMLDCTESRVYQKAAALGLSKSPEYLASPAACRLRRGDNVGAAFRFVKGQTSWNKGKRGYMGANRTSFPKGHRPHTWREVGSMRVRDDGVREIKVSDTGYPPRDWVGLHRLNWIAAHGPIPKGHILRFKDGNYANTLPDNLECITRAENARRNVFKYPLELRQITQLRGAITRQINKRTRREKQD